MQLRSCRLAPPVSTLPCHAAPALPGLTCNHCMSPSAREMHTCKLASTPWRSVSTLFCSCQNSACRRRISCSCQGSSCIRPCTAARPQPRPCVYVFLSLRAIILIWVCSRGADLQVPNL